MHIERKRIALYNEYYGMYIIYRFIVFQGKNLDILFRFIHIIDIKHRFRVLVVL